MNRAASLGFATRLALCLSCALLVTSCKAQKEGAADAQFQEFTGGVAYANFRDTDIPWSIHVVRVNRADPTLVLRTPHAAGGVGGIGLLSEQMEALRRGGVEPLAGVNGDFYARDRSAYAGDPRGLQIDEGDLISGPVGGVSFWVDATGGFHSTNVSSAFKATLADGTSIPFGLNEARRDGAVLYTPAMGPSTATRSGTEAVLEPAGPGPWLPLPAGESLAARVREVRQAGDTRIVLGTMIFSLPPMMNSTAAKLAAGEILKLSTATIPDLRGAKSAISGGPALVRHGVVQRIQLPRGSGQLAYEFRSMLERHPRSALGWNDRFLFLIQVDGRQANLSVGMTLEELGRFALKQLDVTDAMNLDGGVSATLWADGRVRNNPANRGQEREVANAVAIVRPSKPR